MSKIKMSYLHECWPVYPKMMKQILHEQVTHWEAHYKAKLDASQE